MAATLSTASRVISYLTAGLLLFFIIFNLSPFLRLSSSPAKSRHLDFQIPTISTQFKHLRKLEDLGPAGDEFWSSAVLPDQGGFLWGATNSTEEMGGREGWGITMFHSLHCLQMMREVFKLAVFDGQDELHRRPHPQRMRTREPHNHDMDPKHALHCFSYLYQVITCGADGTLEPPQRLFDATGRQTDWVVNGAGIQHTCRDSTLLWEVVKQSETKPFDRLDWKAGHTVWDLFP